MKFKKENFLQKIGDWDLINNQLYFIQDMKIKNYPLNNIILNLNDYWGVNFKTDFFNLYTSKSLNTFYNYSGKKIRQLDNLNIFILNTMNDYIYFDRIDKLSKYNNQVICEGKLILSNVLKGFLFYQKDESIHKYNLKTYKNLWSFSIAQLGSFKDSNGKEKRYEVIKFIGIFENQLLVALNDRYILSLYAETGEFIKLVNICDFLQLDPVTFGNMRPHDLYLDESKGKILWLSYHYYLQIDASSLEPKLIKNYAVENTETWWNIKHSTPYEKFIIFNADYGNKRITPNYIGIAEIETGEILWSEKIIDKGFLVNNPQFADNKIYQLDSNGSLFIYEKD